MTEQAGVPWTLMVYHSAAEMAVDFEVHQIGPHEGRGSGWQVVSDHPTREEAAAAGRRWLAEHLLPGWVRDSRTHALR